MRLSHDSEGFLTGPIIPDIKRSNDLLNSIKSDVAAIKRAVVAQNIRAVERSSQTTTPASGNRSSQRFTPASNSERPPGTQADNSVTPNRAANASTRADGQRSRNEQGEVAPQAGANRADQQPPATPNRERARNASGRFIVDDSAARERSVEPNACRDNRGRFTSNGEGDEQSQRTLLNGLADRIATAVTDSSTGLEEVDPTVRAFNEIAEPLARGYQALFSGEKDDVRWYRRIFGELRLFRKEDSAFNKATRRSLNEIEDRQPVVDDDGGRSFFGGLLGSILPWLLGAIAGLGPMLLTGIKTVFGGFGLILRTVLAGIFSPIGLAITAAATAAWGLFTDEGRKFFANLGPRISEAWDGAVDWFKETFPGITDKFSKVAETIADLWQPIADFFKDKLGIVQKGVDTVKNVADAANTYIKEKTGVDVKQVALENIIEPSKEVFRNGTEAVKSIPKSLKERWNDAKQHLGTAAVKAGIDPGIVAKITGFESGFNSEARPTRKDGSRISSAHGYGQFLDATWTDILNKYGTKYGVQNAGNLTKEEAAKLRSDKDLQAAMLAEFTRANIEKGRALGGTNDDANVYALHNLGEGTGANFLKALKSNPNAPVNSVKGMTNAVISGNKSLYGDGNITIQEAYGRMTKAMSRGEVFARDIVEYSRSVMPSLASMPKPVYASSPSPSVPAMPKPPAFADAPPLIIPMASDASKRSVNVTVDQGDVGQDVSCRKIAHIVLGGLGGV
ncbi:hypothetical protein [Methylobacter luteus]|uniref:hypothetical protein n=1 Tax=Methylobacter luteus TaxID=415 RepID=UPI0004197876|nr:hypothetical protein [Methylobacter luteus]